MDEVTTNADWVGEGVPSALFSTQHQTTAGPVAVIRLMLSGLTQIIRNPHSAEGLSTAFVFLTEFLETGLQNLRVKRAFLHSEIVANVTSLLETILQQPRSSTILKHVDVEDGPLVAPAKLHFLRSLLLEPETPAFVFADITKGLVNFERRFPKGTNAFQLYHNVSIATIVAALDLQKTFDLRGQSGSKPQILIWALREFLNSERDLRSDQKDNQLNARVFVSLTKFLAQVVLRREEDVGRPAPTGSFENELSVLQGSLEALLVTARMVHQQSIRIEEPVLHTAFQICERVVSSRSTASNPTTLQRLAKNEEVQQLSAQIVNVLANSLLRSVGERPQAMIDQVVRSLFASISDHRNIGHRSSDYDTAQARKATVDALEKLLPLATPEGIGAGEPERNVVLVLGGVIGKASEMDDLRAAAVSAMGQVVQLFQRDRRVLEAVVAELFEAVVPSPRRGLSHAQMFLELTTAANSTTSSGFIGPAPETKQLKAAVKRLMREYGASLQ